MKWTKNDKKASRPNRGESSKTDRRRTVDTNHLNARWSVLLTAIGWTAPAASGVYEGCAAAPLVDHYQLLNMAQRPLSSNTNVKNQSGALGPVLKCICTDEPMRDIPTYAPIRHSWQPMRPGRGQNGDKDTIDPTKVHHDRAGSESWPTGLQVLLNNSPSPLVHTVSRKDGHPVGLLLIVADGLRSHLCHHQIRWVPCPSVLFRPVNCVEIKPRRRHQVGNLQSLR